MNEDAHLIRDFEAFESQSSVQTSLLIQSSFTKRLSMLEKIKVSIFIDRNQFFLQEKNWRIILKTLMFLALSCYLSAVFVNQTLFLGLPISLAAIFTYMVVLNFMQLRYFEAIQHLAHLILIFLYLQKPSFFPFIALVAFSLQLIVFYSLDTHKQSENINVLKLILTLFYFMSTIDINQEQFKPFIRFSLVGFFLGILTDFSLLTMFLSLKRLLNLSIKTFAQRKIRLVYYYSYKFEHSFLRDVFNSIVYGFFSYLLIIYGFHMYFDDKTTLVLMWVFFSLFQLTLLLMLVFFTFISFKKNLVS